jgi:hypothetical protein
MFLLSLNFLRLLKISFYILMNMYHLIEHLPFRLDFWNIITYQSTYAFLYTEMKYNGRC